MQKTTVIRNLGVIAVLIIVTQLAFAQSGTSSSEEFTERDSKSGIGLFVEPAIKYDDLEGKVEYPAPFTKSDVSARGLGVGARLGFHVSDMVFLAAEANYSQLKLEEDSNNYKSNGDAYSFGPTIGVQTPWAGVRIWGTYLAGGEFNPSDDNGIDLKFKDLRGYRVGLGFRVLSVSASLEYQDATYNKTELEKAGPLSGTTDNVKMNNTAWVLGISFPITL